MKPVLRGWIVLLFGGILFVAGLFWVRGIEPPERDPSVLAQRAIENAFGMYIAIQPARGGGVSVGSVEPGSKAEEAGIQAGDRIAAVGDRSVWHVLQLAEFMNQHISIAGATAVLVDRDDEWSIAVLPSQELLPLPEPDDHHHH